MQVNFDSDLGQQYTPSCAKFTLQTKEEAALWFQYVQQNHLLGTKREPTIQLQQPEETAALPEEQSEWPLLYKKVVLDVKSKPKDVADFFLAIVEASFGTVEPDPQAAAQLLETVTKYSDELLRHFSTQDAHAILQARTKRLKAAQVP